MEKISCREVIVSRLGTRGDGTEYNPIRNIIQVFEKDGTLIAEEDIYQDIPYTKDLIDYAKWVIETKFMHSNVRIEDLGKWVEEWRDSKG